MMRPKLQVVSILLGLAVLAAGCVTVGPEGKGGEASRTASFSYTWQDPNLAIIVDVELARRRAEEPYFPLGIKIANKRLKRIIVDRETLFLVDEADAVYPMPSVEELSLQYDKLTPDNKFKSQTGILGDQIMTGFSYFRKAEGRLFPQTQGGGRTVRTIYVQTKGYMEDLVYFPMPAGGIKGKTLRLRLDVFELGKPLDVAFRID
jgi:hypothetical protein